VFGASEKVEMVIDLRDTKLPDKEAPDKRYIVIGNDDVSRVTLSLVTKIFKVYIAKLDLALTTCWKRITLRDHTSVFSCNKVPQQYSLIPSTEFWDFLMSRKKYSQR